ncbi:MAG: hypothetical protein IJ439_00405 [Tyzzerella sp.]|nr:hypothetical protein [Tyzzerella sp.]
MKHPPLELFLGTDFKGDFYERKNVGNTGIGRFYVNWELLCRHRNVLKSTEKVKALSWLAGGNPRGCNVGKYVEWSRGNSCGFVWWKMMSWNMEI